MRQTLCALLEKAPLAERRDTHAEKVATLPQRLGGLGLRSAVRTSAAAYWASWADTLPMIQQRCPALAAKVLEELEKGVGSSATSCVAAGIAKATLEHEGYGTCPWRQLVQGERPPEVDRPEPGEYRHGWQYHAAARRETHYRKARVCQLQQANASSAMFTGWKVRWLPPDTTTCD